MSTHDLAVLTCWFAFAFLVLFGTRKKLGRSGVIYTRDELRRVKR